MMPYNPLSCHLPDLTCACSILGKTAERRINILFRTNRDDRRRFDAEPFHVFDIQVNKDRATDRHRFQGGDPVKAIGELVCHDITSPQTFSQSSLVLLWDPTDSILYPKMPGELLTATHIPSFRDRDEPCIFPWTLDKSGIGPQETIVAFVV